MSSSGGSDPGSPGGQCLPADPQILSTLSTRQLRLLVGRKPLASAVPTASQLVDSVSINRLAILAKAGWNPSGCLFPDPEQPPWNPENHVPSRMLTAERLLVEAGLTTANGRLVNAVHLNDVEELALAIAQGGIDYAGGLAVAGDNLSIITLLLEQWFADLAALTSRKMKELVLAAIVQSIANAIQLADKRATRDISYNWDGVTALLKIYRERIASTWPAFAIDPLPRQYHWILSDTGRPLPGWFHESILSVEESIVEEAARRGDMETIRWMTRYPFGESFPSRYIYLLTMAIGIARHYGHFEIAKLLDSYFQQNQAMPDLLVSLLNDIASCDASIVDRLSKEVTRLVDKDQAIAGFMDKGADFAEESRYADSRKRWSFGQLLNIAIDSRCEPAMSWLLSQGADSSEALPLAVRHNDQQLVEELAQHSSEISSNAIEEAARYGRWELAETFGSGWLAWLDPGNQYQGVRDAAKYGQLSVVNALFEDWGDFSHDDARDIMDIAVTNGHVDVAEWVLEQANRDAQSLLIDSKQLGSSGYLSVVEKLLPALAGEDDNDVPPVARLGDCLEGAASSGNTEIVALLLNHPLLRGEPLFVDQLSIALRPAAIKGHLPVVRQLLAAAAEGGWKLIIGELLAEVAVKGFARIVTLIASNDCIGSC